MEDWKAEFYRRYSTYFGRSLEIDNINQSRPYARHIIKKSFPKNKDSKILDLGCGKGNFMRNFIGEGYRNVYGVDISEEDVLFARSFGVSQIERDDIFHYLFNQPDQSYDVILLLDVIEHFHRADILKLLTESYRVLRPNGTIIIHVPNAEGLFGSRIRYSDITHEFSFTSKSLSQILTYAGYSSFKWYEDKPIPHGIVSVIRRLVWIIGTFPFRILHAAETGSFSVVLSQNLLFSAIKG